MYYKLCINQRFFHTPIAFGPTTQHVFELSTDFLCEEDNLVFKKERILHLQTMNISEKTLMKEVYETEVDEELF